MIASLCPTKLKTAGISTDVCIDVGEEEMTCTREVLETRTLHDNISINVGVTQRIDGSDAEKQAVRDVLKHMDNYFFHEVLALPEYEYARSRWYGELDAESNAGKRGFKTRMYHYIRYLTHLYSLLFFFRDLSLIGIPSTMWYAARTPTR